jgi:hypothetical protein
LIVVALAIGQTLRDRPVDWWLWGSALALIAFGLFRHQLRHLKFGPSGVELAIEKALPGPREQLAEPSQAQDLKLLISTGIPVGAAEAMMGTDHIVQVTAVNTSVRPLGVSSLGLSLSDGRYIPVFEVLETPTNVRLPGVLQPQMSATTWLRYDGLKATLATEQVEIVAIIANMVDGTTRRQTVPKEWRTL